MHKIDELQCSLEKASEDDQNHVYMVHSQLKVCEFDKVKEWYVSEKVPMAKPTPKSNDALYFDKDGCFFIEFKNGKITDGVNYEINKKIYDSLFILFDLKYMDSNGSIVDTISYTRENMTYILVYNEENYRKCEPTRQTRDGIKRQKERQQDTSRGVSQSYHRELLYKTTRKLAGEEFILFGLDQFKNYFFKNVCTYTEKEFQQKFIDIKE